MIYDPCPHVYASALTGQIGRRARYLVYEGICSLPSARRSKTCSRGHSSVHTPRNAVNALLRLFALNMIVYSHSHRNSV